MDIITRAAAGIPPRPSGLTRHTGPWPGITWHHTGGAPTTWRAIYDWQVHGRPPAERLADIGYSFGIRAGRVTELRGWDYRPAGDHQNSRLQVVFMGTYARSLPTSADLAAALDFARYAEQRNGQPMPGKPHCDIWPAGHEHSTDCPGALAAWVRRNLTTIEEDDMTPEQDRLLRNVERILTTGWSERDANGIRYTDTDPGRTLENPLTALGTTLQTLVDRPPATSAPVDVDALAAALRPHITAAAEDAVRRVLGAVDGATPAH